MMQSTEGIIFWFMMWSLVLNEKPKLNYVKS